MRSTTTVLHLSFLLVLGIGCGQQGEFKEFVGPGSVIELQVGGKTLSVELATDDISRRKGMMFRETLGEDEGMLFIFPRRRPQSFWMKNTTVPLSVAFIGPEGEILQIEDMRPHDERQTRSKDEVRYALEVNQGWFQKNGIAVGSRLANFRMKVERISSN